MDAMKENVDGENVWRHRPTVGRIERTDTMSGKAHSSIEMKTWRIVGVERYSQGEWSETVEVPTSTPAQRDEWTGLVVYEARVLDADEQRIAALYRVLADRYGDESRLVPHGHLYEIRRPARLLPGGGAGWVTVARLQSVRSIEYGPEVPVLITQSLSHHSLDSLRRATIRWWRDHTRGGAGYTLTIDGVDCTSRLDALSQHMWESLIAAYRAGTLARQVVDPGMSAPMSQSEWHAARVAE